MQANVVLGLVLATIAAYLLGSIPTAFLVAKWRRGIDIRRFGSGNVGASNAIASGSRWTSIIVFVFDFVKGLVPVLVARSANMPLYQQIIVGLGAICGHNWTIFLKFSGGRGLLTTLGVIFALAPWLAALVLATNVVWAPLRQLALGSLVAVVLLPVLSWFLSQPLQLERSWTLTLGFTAMLFLVLLRRLTAPRSELASSVAAGQLVVNRLLYDRDIRDRKAWLGRRSLGGDSSR